MGCLGPGLFPLSDVPSGAWELPPITRGVLA